MEDGREMSLPNTKEVGNGEGPRYSFLLVVWYLSISASLKCVEDGGIGGSMGEARKIEGATADAVLTIMRDREWSLQW